jgi:hypothetical protein
MLILYSVNCSLFNKIDLYILYLDLVIFSLVLSFPVSFVSLMAKKHVQLKQTSFNINIIIML